MKLLLSIRNFFRRLFGKVPVVVAPVVIAPPIDAAPPEPIAFEPIPVEQKRPTFVENFANLSKWNISSWSAPGGGKFNPANALISNGMLCLKLQQVKTDSGITSIGGEIATKEKFGYGTYEFEVRASSTAATPDAIGSPVSGSITGCFNYAKNSITEIDMEVEGGTRSGYAQFTSWNLETNPNQNVKIPTKPLPHEEFKTYKFIWTPQGTTFYINGVEVGKHTKVIPSEPAPFMFNHWGTNSSNWGGTATPGVERYMWVKSFSYTPL